MNTDLEHLDNTLDTVNHHFEYNKAYIKDNKVYSPCTSAQMARVYLSRLPHAQLEMVGREVHMPTYIGTKEDDSPYMMARPYICVYQLAENESFMDFYNRLLEEVANWAEYEGEMSVYQRAMHAVANISIYCPHEDGTYDRNGVYDR